LPHRIRRGPFQQNEIGVEELQERISQLQGQQTAEGKEDKQSTPTEESQDTGDQKKKRAAGPK
jgi:Mg-chelatase subunit ChlI